MTKSRTEADEKRKKLEDGASAWGRRRKTASPLGFPATTTSI